MPSITQTKMKSTQSRKTPLLMQKNKLSKMKDAAARETKKEEIAAYTIAIAIITDAESEYSIKNAKMQD